MKTTNSGFQTAPKSEIANPKSNMDWNTIYITGNANFWDEVNKKLTQSGLKFLIGSFEQSADNKFIGLYWLDASVGLHELKSAIGEKLISKWRLCFGKEWGQPNGEVASRNSTKRFLLVEGNTEKSCIA
jgi:hypothetical protein